MRLSASYSGQACGPGPQETTALPHIFGPPVDGCPIFQQLLYICDASIVCCRRESLAGGLKGEIGSFIVSLQCAVRRVNSVNPRRKHAEFSANQ